MPATSLPEIIDLREPDLRHPPEFGDARTWSSMRDAKVAVLGCLDEMTYSVMAGIGSAGVHVEVMSADAHTRLAASRYCRAVHQVPAPIGGRYPADMVRRVRDVLRGGRIDVVVAADYDSLVWLSDHARDLAPTIAFPGPTRSQIEQCNDKWQLMGLCESLGIDHPHTCLLESVDDVSAFASWGRIVVKPRSEGFGYGVYELASGTELADHLRRTDRPGNRLPLLVQEHVAGEDVDVTLLVDHGQTISGIVQQRLPDGGSMRFSTAPKLLAPAVLIAGAVGFHGVMDFDLRHDVRTGRVAVIECNPRFPGSLINKSWAGVNLALEGLALALGLTPDGPGVRLPAVYHPPRARHAPLLARPAFWFGDLTPTRHGWAARLRDPQYAFRTATAQLAARFGR